MTPAAALVLAAQRRRLWRNFGIRAGSLALILVAWEVVGLLVPPIFLAPFHRTVTAAITIIEDGTLLRATLSSLSVLLLGLAISVGLGVPLGLAMGRYRTLRWILEPYVNGLYSTPTVAFLPIVTFWFGLYLPSKVVIVVLIAIFPILKNTMAGVMTVGHELLEPAKSMRASKSQIFNKVMLPATLPFVMAGLRLSIGRGIVGVVVGEFFTAQTGLGGMVVAYASRFRTAEMFVPIMVLVAIGMILTAAVKLLHLSLAPWKESERDEGL